MKTLKKNRLLSAAFDRSHLLIAIKMGLIVGTILNCINQGDCLIRLDFEKLQVGKFLITYTVPFFVSLYTSTMLKLRLDTK